MHASCFLSFRLCMRDGDKRRQAKAYSLCGWKLSFQLAWHPVIRSIHLSGLSLVATLRARSLSAFSLSGLQLFSDPDTGQPLPLSILPSTEETRDTEADTALLQPTHCVYIQQINTNMVGGYEILPGAWTQQQLPLTSYTHKHTHKGKQGKLLLWLQNSQALSWLCLSDRLKDAARARHHTYSSNHHFNFAFKLNVMCSLILLHIKTKTN